MAIDKEKLKQQKKMRKKNLAFKEYRFFTSVPKNSVLIVENSLFKTAKVVSGGFYISFFPFLKTVGVSLETYNYDFPPEKFQAGALLVSNDNNNNNDNENENDKNEKYDIIIDAAISYRILGGDKPKKVDPNHDQIPANETIKSVNKSLRRTWREKHGALKVYYDLKNKRESIEKQIQIAVYDTLRMYVASHTYEDILAAQIDENSVLNQNIKQSLEPFGIEVVNFKIQKVNQEKTIDEAEARRKVIESDANAKAKATVIEAEAKATAIKTTGLAEAEVEGQKIQSKVDAYGNRSYQEIAAINGQDFKQVNLNLGGTQIPNNVENLTHEQITVLRALLDNLEQKTQNAATSSTTVSNPDSDDSNLEADIQHNEEHNNGQSWDFDDQPSAFLHSNPSVSKNREIIEKLEQKNKILKQHQNNQIVENSTEVAVARKTISSEELDQLLRGIDKTEPSKETGTQTEEMGRQYTINRGYEQ